MSDQSTRMEDAAKLTRLRRLAHLAPNDPDVHFTLARELAKRSRNDEAATELHAVITLAPSHLEARKLLEQLTAATTDDAMRNLPAGTRSDTR